MMKYLIPSFTLLVAGCGSQSSKQKIATQPTEVATESIEEPNTQESNQVILQDSTSGSSEMKSLNDVRFGNWTEKSGSTMIIFVLYAHTLMRVTKEKLKMKF